MPTKRKASSEAPQGWVLFFYSVPAKPVNNRMKVWRKLLGAGAIQLRGAVYLLPRSEEHIEFVQWLTAEITTMRGEAAFVRVDHIDTMEDTELVELFNQQRAREYAPLTQEASDLERRLTSIKKGGSNLHKKRLTGQFAKIQRGFEAICRVDFFSSPAGTALEKQLLRLKRDLDSLLPVAGPAEPSTTIPTRNISAYQGRTWVTRNNPFVDRMASAWLIKRFIDPEAGFAFHDTPPKAPAGAILFDMPGAEFTHVGELCTFEVLLKSFGLKGSPLKKLAELVHDLDLKDDKYGAAEAMGVEKILTAIRKTSTDDQQTLRRGMEIFEMLYVSQTS